MIKINPEIKAGLNLLKKVTVHTASNAKHTVQRKPMHKIISAKCRSVEWQAATKTAKTTAKVTASCAVMLVGGLFAAIIAD
tara:strand:+ start:40713 stop:40955 length:243 start_codon:yes stop_codon:yes gene_type:complete